MAIETYENEMDGMSYEITIDTPISDLPKEVSKNLTEIELNAFLDMKSYLKEKLSKSSILAVSKFLECLLLSNNIVLEYHTSEFVDNQMLFRFDLKNGISPAISLPTDEENISCPKVLEDLYTIIGSTKHKEWEMAGGLFRRQDICTIADMGVWLDEENILYAPDESFAFYGSAYGDNLCFNENGKVLSYQHEGGYLAEWGSIEDFINKYFGQLIEGQFLNCDIED